MTVIHADLDPGTPVTYHGSIAGYGGQDMTVARVCGRWACCSPVTVPGIPYAVSRLVLIAADGRILRHVHPQSVTTAKESA